MRVGGQCHAPAALPPENGPGTHLIRALLGPRCGLGGAGKIAPPPPPPGFGPQAVQPAVAMLTELPRPTFIFINHTFYIYIFLNYNT